jgi:hypothetical protein
VAPDQIDDVDPISDDLEGILGDAAHSRTPGALG